MHSAPGGRLDPSVVTERKGVETPVTSRVGGRGVAKPVKARVQGQPGLHGGASEKVAGEEGDAELCDCDVEAYLVCVEEVRQRVWLLEPGYELV